MAITGIQIIEIGAPNESTGSDPLITAFTKTKDNFTTLFNNASPYNTFTGNGVTLTANATAGTLNIDNAGVLSLTAGDSSIILSEPTPGNIIITASSGGNGGGVSSVGITSSTLSVTNTPIISSGNIVLNLPTTGITAGQYTNPTVTGPAVVTVNAGSSCGALASSINFGLVANDNCSVASTTNNGPTTFPLGYTSITWTVTDGAGNTATLNQTIQVVDATGPSIVPAANVAVAAPVVVIYVAVVVRLTAPNAPVPDWLWLLGR